MLFDSSSLKVYIQIEVIIILISSVYLTKKVFCDILKIENRNFLFVMYNERYHKYVKT
jgi:hypothetical protein